MFALGWVLLGIVVALVARLFMPGHHPWDFLATTVLGGLGALIGGFIVFSLSGGARPGQPSGWVLAAVGAAVAVGAYAWVSWPQKV